GGGNCQWRTKRRTGERILTSCWRRRCRTSARRLQLQCEAARRSVNAGSVTLFNDRFSDSIREKFAIFPIARLIALGAITQKPALYEDRRIVRETQDAKICFAYTAIRRAGDRHQLGLNPIRELG